MEITIEQLTKARKLGPDQIDVLTHLLFGVEIFGGFTKLKDYFLHGDAYIVRSVANLGLSYIMNQFGLLSDDRPIDSLNNLILQKPDSSSKFFFYNIMHDEISEILRDRFKYGINRTILKSIGEYFDQKIPDSLLNIPAIPFSGDYGMMKGFDFNTMNCYLNEFNDEYLVIVQSGSEPEKRFAPRIMNYLTHKAAQSWGHIIVLTDSELSRKNEEFNLPSNAEIKQIGDINYSSAILYNAHRIITTDTAKMHLAGGLKFMKNNNLAHYPTLKELLSTDFNPVRKTDLVTLFTLGSPKAWAVPGSQSVRSLSHEFIFDKGWINPTRYYEEQHIKYKLNRPTLNDIRLLTPFIDKNIDFREANDQYVKMSIEFAAKILNK